MIEESVLQEAFERDTVLVMSAAGNSPDMILYPAGYPSVLSIGAVDNKKEVAPFSPRNEQVRHLTHEYGVPCNRPFISH